MEISKQALRCVQVSSDATTVKMKSDKGAHDFVFDRSVLEMCRGAPPTAYSLIVLYNRLQYANVAYPRIPRSAAGI